jgi:hypothetical protein
MKQKGGWKGGMGSWKRRMSLLISKLEAHEDAERKGFAEGVVQGEFAAGDFVVIGSCAFRRAFIGIPPAGRSVRLS